MRIWTGLVAFTISVAGAAPLAGDGPYDPQWQVGDTWTVRTTYVQGGRPKEDVSPEAWKNVTNLFYAAMELCEHTLQTCDYSYRVESVIETNKSRVALVKVTALANQVYGVYDWELWFDTKRMTLLKVGRHTSARGKSTLLTWSSPFGNDSWLTDWDSFSKIILDFPRIPADPCTEKKTIPRLGNPDMPIVQETRSTDTNLVIMLTRTNAMYGLDQKATFVWEKGKKWWTSAKQEWGTNVVKSAVLVK